MTAQAVFKESLHAAPDEMARTLQDVLGQRMVAYVTGQKAAKTVGRWAQGTEPSEQALGRLRALYRTILILRAGDEDDRTIRGWLTSPNPDLDDEIAAEVIRVGDSQRVFNAARTFAEVE
jgi:hypothetical protein